MVINDHRGAPDIVKRTGLTLAAVLKVFTLFTNQACFFTHYENPSPQNFVIKLYDLPTGMMT